MRTSRRKRARIDDVLTVAEGLFELAEVAIGLAGCLEGLLLVLAGLACALAAWLA